MTNPLEQIDAVLESFATSREKLFRIVDIVRASQSYVYVPVEPTEAMIRSGSIWCRESPEVEPSVKDECMAANTYRAMLAAAPKPGAEG